MACKVLQWFGNLFHSAKVDIGRVLVPIMEAVQGLETSGVLPTIAAVLDKATGHLSTTINDALKKGIVAGIAGAFAIEGLPDDPTEQDVKDFTTRVVGAFAGKKTTQSLAGQVINNLAAQLYVIMESIITAAHTSGNNVTFAQITGAVEEAYQDYVQDVANAQEN